MIPFDACSLPEELRTVAERHLMLEELESQLTDQQRAVFILLVRGTSKAAVRKRLRLTSRQLGKIIDHIRILYILAVDQTE